MRRLSLPLALLPALFVFRISTALADGACCAPPCFECVLLSEAECDALGGSFSGEGVPCDPLPCVPISACCLEDNSCRLVSQATCIELDGAWAEPCIECDPDPCVSPVEQKGWGELKAIYRSEG